MLFCKRDGIKSGLQQKTAAFPHKMNNLKVEGFQIDYQKCSKINKKDQQKLLTQKFVALIFIRLAYCIKTVKSINDHQRQDDIFGKFYYYINHMPYSAPLLKCPFV